MEPAYAASGIASPCPRARVSRACHVRLAGQLPKPGAGVSSRANGYHGFTPSLSFRVDLTGHCAEGGGREVLMNVTHSVSARIRKWLGLLGKRPAAKAPYGAGAWGR
jgi:hypothetical protein